MATPYHAGGSAKKALAAYRLGMTSQMLTVWHRLFLEKPEFEWGTADGVRAAIKDMDGALVALAAEVPVNIYGDLRAWLKRQEDRWTAILTVVWEYHGGKKRWDDQLLNEGDLDPSPQLQSLLAVAIESMSALKPWFLLGSEIGRYQQAIDCLNRGSQLPAIGSILAAAGTLMAEGSIALPVLAKLHEHADESPSLSPRAVLTRIVGSTGESLNMYGEKFESFVVGKLLFALDVVIQDQLQKAIEPLPGTADSEVVSAAERPQPMTQEAILPGTTSEIVSTDAKPHWVKMRDEHWVGELRVGEQVVRTVRELATNIIVILDAFEEDGWPPQIFDPLSNPDSQKRHETIRSLNDGLTVIRFHGDGTSEGICWRMHNSPVTSQGPP